MIVWVDKDVCHKLQEEGGVVPSYLAEPEEKAGLTGNSCVPSEHCDTH